jgi:hypothetical protein
VKKLLFMCLFLSGCPKQVETVEDRERKLMIEELKRNEDLFEDLPESNHENEEDEEGE